MSDTTISYGSVNEAIDDAVAKYKNNEAIDDILRITMFMMPCLYLGLLQ